MIFRVEVFPKWSDFIFTIVLCVVLHCDKLCFHPIIGILIAASELAFYDWVAQKFGFPRVWSKEENVVFDSSFTVTESEITLVQRMTATTRIVIITVITFMTVTQIQNFPSGSWKHEGPLASIPEGEWKLEDSDADFVRETLNHLESEARFAISLSEEEALYSNIQID